MTFFAFVLFWFLVLVAIVETIRRRYRRRVRYRDDQEKTTGHSIR